MVCMIHQRAAAKGVPPEAPISKFSETACPCRTKETTEFGAVVAGNAVTAGLTPLMPAKALAMA